MWRVFHPPCAIEIGVLLKLVTEFSKAIVCEDFLTLRKAMQAIDAGGLKAALIVDSEGKLCGLLTDGDVRRALLEGYSLVDSAHDVINRQPLCIPTPSMTLAKSLASDKGVDLIIYGVLGGEPNGIFVGDSDAINKELPPVLVMAGGKGTRLRPLTENKPKPLVEIAGVPVLHRILASLATNGFKTIYISLNYLGSQIEASIGDGKQFGLNVEYVSEESPLGTAGSISLITHLIGNQKLIVMNADLIVDLDFHNLVYEHEYSGNDLTIAVREIVTSIPFGVVKIKEGQVTSIEEKPSYSDLVSAGVYCIGKSARGLIGDLALDMPELINRTILAGLRVGAFPIHLDWIDIGTPSDLRRAERHLGESS